MTLEPLFAAGPVIAAHAFAALGAFAVGIIQFAGPKGTTTHRTLGWLWVLSMASVAISSFWINGIKQYGNFSWIHGLSIFVLIMLPLAVLAARRHRVSAHSKTMIGLFLGALVIAGLFTLLPGRIIHQVIFASN